MLYRSASEVVFHEEALYQVNVPLPLPLDRVRYILQGGAYAVGSLCFGLCRLDGNKGSTGFEGMLATVGDCRDGERLRANGGEPSLILTSSCRVSSSSLRSASLGPCCRCTVSKRRPVKQPVAVQHCTVQYCTVHMLPMSFCYIQKYAIWSQTLEKRQIPSHHLPHLSPALFHHVFYKQILDYL